MKEENLCILIDFENIAAGTERENLGRFNTKLVMNHLKEKGRVVISRAYGDWGRFAKFKQALLEQGISMMELTSYRGQDKNRADIALVVDAMELVYSRPHIQTFVLLSGDSDFTPLVMKLRELDKRIIGLGTRKATSRLLASSCDEFIFYDNLLKRSEPDEESTEETSLTPKPITSQEAFTLLVDTIKAIQRDEPRPVSAGMVKQFILRKTPTFDETDFGHSGFTDFLEAAAKAELISVVNNDKGGGYLVSIKDTGPVSPKIEPHKYESPLAQKWSELLLEEGFHPTRHFIRHTIVHEFVDHILERRAKKKRSTLVFTYGDIARRCRRTDPSASTSEVDSILNALYKAGELFGNDQKPIRSKKANFTIKRDAEELLENLRAFYVRLLLEKNTIEHLTENNEALCELLWNDTAHIEETKAILQRVSVEKETESTTTESVETVMAAIEGSENTETTPAPIPEVLESPVEEPAPAKKKAEKKVERKKPTERKSGKKSTAKVKEHEGANTVTNPESVAPEHPVTESSQEISDTVEPTPIKKHRKTTRKKPVKTADKVTTTVPDSESESAEESKPAAKKTTTKKATSKKTTAKKAIDKDTAKDSSSETDNDTLEEIKKPKKTRKTTRKKAAPEPSDSEDGK